MQLPTALALSLALAVLVFVPGPSSAFAPAPFSSSSFAARAASRRPASIEKSAEELNLEAQRLRLQADQLKLEVQQAELKKAQELVAKALGTAGEGTEEQVLEVNQAFVEAFRSKSVSKMKKVWSHLSASLTHVGKPEIRGIEAVCSSFHQAFSGGSIGDVIVRGERIVALSSQVGVVSCTLDVFGANNASKSSWVTTNVFTFDEREKRWLLVEHHCSPVLFPVGPIRVAKSE